jgi:type I restriction enzyme M protein
MGTSARSSDDGILNTASAASLRKFLLQRCQLRAVVRLPEETFKPNKINVRSSVLLLRKRESEDVDLDQKYKVTFIDVKTLGYQGSGDAIRNFDFEAMLTEIEGKALDAQVGSPRGGTHWRAFDIDVDSIIADGTHRLDLKYWEPETTEKVAELAKKQASTIAALNLIPTRRGKSPKAETYVDEKDGYALVVKAGTNITKFGELAPEGDYVEKDIYDGLTSAQLKRGDVLIASTGTGTLGKACVFDLDKPALADGHVTIIRPDTSKIDPHYLADYLREGAGAIQIHRLYTGSTGLIELTPEDVNTIKVDLLSGPEEQRLASAALRQAETTYRSTLKTAQGQLLGAKDVFVKPIHLKAANVA